MMTEVELRNMVKNNFLMVHLGAHNFLEVLVNYRMLILMVLVVMMIMLKMMLVLMMVLVLVLEEEDSVIECCYNFEC